MLLEFAPSVNPDFPLQQQTRVKAEPVSGAISISGTDCGRRASRLHSSGFRRKMMLEITGLSS
jgi:hypothetical protein